MTGKNSQGTWVIHMDPKWKRDYKILAAQMDCPVYEVIDAALEQYALGHHLLTAKAMKG